jgi:hypothetical protein
VPATRSSEAGGVQGVAQNIGQSLGTALIGAVLLTGLTTGFHNAILADQKIPPNVQQQIVSGTEEGVPMVSKSQVESIGNKAGLPPDQVNELVDVYGEEQIDALKRALFVAAAFVLVGFWFARLLPNEALKAEESAERPARASPELEVVA